MFLHNDADQNVYCTRGTNVNMYSFAAGKSAYHDDKRTGISTPRNPLHEKTTTHKRVAHGHALLVRLPHVRAAHDDHDDDPQHQLRKVLPAALPRADPKWHEVLVHPTVPPTSVSLTTT